VQKKVTPKDKISTVIIKVIEKRMVVLSYKQISSTTYLSCNLLITWQKEDIFGAKKSIFLIILFWTT